MKWFVTDGPTRRHAFGSTDNVLDEVEPNLGFSLSFGPGSIRPRDGEFAVSMACPSRPSRLRRRTSKGDTASEKQMRRRNPAYP